MDRASRLRRSECEASTVAAPAVEAQHLTATLLGELRMLVHASPTHLL